uniref:Kinesin motor domain-containing protein n=1 Tax=Steinernema glaseri TaxID=37863 RepID=A0A1I7ZIR1_9BILA
MTQKDKEAGGPGEEGPGDKDLHGIRFSNLVGDELSDTYFVFGPATPIYSINIQESSATCSEHHFLKALDRSRAVIEVAYKLLCNVGEGVSLKLKREMSKRSRIEQLLKKGSMLELERPRQIGYEQHSTYTTLIA